ncbi:hypothetical protein INR49_019273 [Caranx melampygus]|nr:hypothetical protein INR49_019273 [Caranx melampygus]
MTGGRRVSETYLKSSAASLTNQRRAGLKWFGSLTNLSTRRAPEKATVKETPKHDGSLGRAKPAVEREQSVDDMESCLHSPGYARSTDMYTHVGTVPRSERQKKSCKGLKEKKKKKKEEEEEEEREGESGGQSQRKAGEHVRDSPLLSALSSLSLSSPDRPLPVSAAGRPLPTTPSPTRTSPLTSAPESCSTKSQVAPSRSWDALEPVWPAAPPRVSPLSWRKLSGESVGTVRDKMCEVGDQKCVRSVRSGGGRGAGYEAARHVLRPDRFKKHC